jgi:hypothetical protein
MTTQSTSTLLDDLERCAALAADPAGYEREVVRWLARLVFERDVGLDTVNDAAEAFAGLRAGDAEAVERLRALCC